MTVSVSTTRVVVCVIDHFVAPSNPSSYVEVDIRVMFHKFLDQKENYIEEVLLISSHQGKSHHSLNSMNPFRLCILLSSILVNYVTNLLCNLLHSLELLVEGKVISIPRLIMVNVQPKSRVC